MKYRSLWLEKWKWWNNLPSLKKDGRRLNEWAFLSENAAWCKQHQLPPRTAEWLWGWFDVRMVLSFWKTCFYDPNTVYPQCDSDSRHTVLLSQIESWIKDHCSEPILTEKAVLCRHLCVLNPSKKKTKQNKNRHRHRHSAKQHDVFLWRR